jgi:hypothetical protein
MIHHDTPQEGAIQLLSSATLYAIGHFSGNTWISDIFKIAGAIGTVAVAFNALYNMYNNIQDIMKKKNKKK